ncbi:MAG TPA: SDR family oxidoreductase [Methylomirabilota bacterium]|jgi:gluconate 5-dehydrogenase|nr:SDR family oxidoreductase [Methylomirabilota bacterium]
MGVLDRFRLDGKRCFVTGGSRGLGREMALAMAEAGADVIIVGRDRPALEAAGADVERRGRSVVLIQADVSQALEAERACRIALEQHGPVHILVNNVGGRRFDIPTEDLELEQWQESVDLNLTSTFICTKLIGGAMVRRGQGGRIINVASVSGMVASRGIGGRSYETSKAAVIHLTRTVAADWAPHRVTVNAIAPGAFLTESNLRWSRLKPAMMDSFKAQIPMGELGRPEDLGPLGVYLASDASRYMTGAVLVIDGGYTAW